MDTATEPREPKTWNQHGAPVERLCALDNLFAATGEVKIKVTKGKRETYITLPIQSVDNERVEAMARQYRPKLPTRREQIDGQWKTVINEADQSYQDRMAEFNRVTSYIWVFMALACDIVDESGTVVWSGNNEVRDLDRARAVVKKMGLVDTQLVEIMRAARNLTASIEEEQAQD